MQNDKMSEGAKAFDRWLDRQDELVAKSQKDFEDFMDTNAGKILKSIHEAALSKDSTLRSVRRVGALRERLAMSGLSSSPGIVPAGELATYHSRGAADDLPENSDVLHFVKQALFFIDRGDRGDIPAATSSLLRACREDVGSHDKNFLVDGLRLLADSNLSKDDLELQGIFLEKARMSIRRFMMAPEVSAKLGRLREPTFRSSSEREIYRYFKRVGRATFKEIEAAFSISESTARRRLQPLIDAGVLDRIDVGSGQPVEFVLIE